MVPHKCSWACKCTLHLPCPVSVQWAAQLISTAEKRGLIFSGTKLASISQISPRMSHGLETVSNLTAQSSTVDKLERLPYKFWSRQGDGDGRSPLRREVLSRTLIPHPKTTQCPHFHCFPIKVFWCPYHEDAWDFLWVSQASIKDFKGFGFFNLLIFNAITSIINWEMAMTMT